MKYIVLTIILSLPAVGIALLVSVFTRDSEQDALDAERYALIEPTAAPPEALQDYGKAMVPELEDMRQLHLLIATALSDTGSAAADYCNTIEDVSRLIKGKNPQRISFISPDHRAFNKKGQLCDRWGNVLEVRFDVPDGFTLRSKGRDETINTKDDLYWPLQ